jgi:hypothetical protein
MFITKIRVNGWQSIGLALLLCSLFVSEGSSANTILKHYKNPVVRKIKCPKDYSIGTLHVISEDQAFGHELDDSHHLQVAARGDLTVTVPEGQMLLLEVNGSIVKHPHCLREFSAPVVECLRSIKMFSMDEGDEKSSQDQFLEDLPRLQGLERINLDRTDVTDKGIAHIQNLPRLNSLGLYLCGVVKGDTISALSTCPNIQFLNIGDCAAFKSKNFAVFPKLPKLEEFQATHANINNESLKYLSLCKNLKIIDLRRDEAVTDEGLHILMSLKLLERLSLD